MRHLHRKSVRLLAATGIAAGVFLATLAATGAFASVDHSLAPKTRADDACADVKGAIKKVQDLLNRKGENAVVLIKGKEWDSYVSVRQVTDFLTFQYLAGELTAREFAAALATMARLRARAKTALRLIIAQLEARAAKLCLGLSLTIEFQGAKQTRNLETNAATPPAHSPGATVQLQSGPQSYGGKVTVTGTLSAGYTVYVAYHGRVWADLGPDGGSFSGIMEEKGFGAANDVSAYACKPGGVGKGQALPSTCSAGAGIDIYWKP